MKQVPTTQTQYLIVGDGRIARHFAEYLSLLDISFAKWSRSTHNLDDFKEKVALSSHILLLITDDAISSFYKKHCDLFQDKTVIHFSGALQLKDTIDLHPVMTFNQETYSKETYLSIGFVTSYEDFNRDKHFPQIPNKIYTIKSEDKPLYHAHCVMAGNFTYLLWTQLQSQFKKWNLPQELYLPYLEQTVRNLSKNNSSTDSLTGPLARKDRKTIEKNLQSLSGNPYQPIYQSFVQAQLGDHFLKDQEL